MLREDMEKVHHIGLRVDADTKAALDAVAAADSRTVSALIRKIIADWLAKNTFAKKN